MILVVMAAGMSSRFGGLKQVTSFGPANELLLDYSVYDAKRVGFNKVIFIIKEENLELFKEVVGSHLEGNIEVEYVFQKLDDIPNFVNIPTSRVKPWGTGHALYSVRNSVDDDFLIINADDFYGLDAFQKVSEYFKTTSDVNKACMVGYKLKNTLSDEGTVNRGVCQIENGLLVKIDERLKIKEDDGIITYQEDDKLYLLDENSIVSVNTWGFSKEIFKYLDEELNKFFKENVNNLATAEFMLPNIIQNLIDKKIIKLRVFNTDNRWMGVTYKEDVDKVKEGIKKLVKEGIYPPKLWK